jgi:hypothetical protein
MTKMYGKRLKIADDKPVAKLVTGNPKRGKPAERFSLYRNCKIVADVVAKYVAKGYTARLAYADLRWDQNHEFIKIG